MSGRPDDGGRSRVASLMSTPTTTAGAGGEPAALVWLRRDLRLHDHPALVAALARRPRRTVLVFVLDPRVLAPAPLVSDLVAEAVPRTGGHRLRFLCESLAELRAACRARGGDLVVRRGAPEVELAALVRETGADRVFVHDEPGTEEARDLRRTGEAVEDVGAMLSVHVGSALYDPGELPFAARDLPDVFSRFRRAVEGKRARRGEPAVEVPPPERTPEALPPLPTGLDPGALPDAAALAAEAGVALPAPDPRATMAFPGGERAGLARLQGWAFERDRLRTYKKTRNGMLGPDDSSRLSPWLAHGCLSPRHVYHEIRRYERERVRNDDTYWLVFELLWREFFRLVARRHGRRLFLVGGLEDRRIPWEPDAAAFERWRTGTTGFPLVDANLRELAATGYMSNRGRQNVASFLARNLGLDWRLGAWWFESMLLDHDVASNWGNWLYVAGVGNDPREFRWFNVVKQGRDYDPEAAYLRHWLPELALLADDLVHEPWRASDHERAMLDASYPERMVDLHASAERLRSHHEQVDAPVRPHATRRR